MTLIPRHKACHLIANRNLKEWPIVRVRQGVEQRRGSHFVPTALYVVKEGSHFVFLKFKLWPVQDFIILRQNTGINGECQLAG